MAVIRKRRKLSLMTDLGLSHRRSPPIFPFKLFELAKEPQLNAKRAPVASQPGPFCKPVWPISGPVSDSSRCQ